MAKIMKFAGHIMACLAAAALFAMVPGCCPENANVGMLSCSESLQLMYESWLKKGKPPGYRPSDFFLYAPSGRNFLVVTNEIRIESVIYHGRFGVRSDEFPGGMLVVTDEQVFVWVPDDRGREGKVLPYKWLPSP